MVIATGRLRVVSLEAHPGDRAEGPILGYAETTKVVTVALDVALQSIVSSGVPAQITLPDPRASKLDSAVVRG